jgi:hypothetical protein
MLKNSSWPSSWHGVAALAMIGGYILTQGMVGRASGQTMTPSPQVQEAARQVMERAQGSVVTIVAPVRGLPGEPGATIETLGTVVSTAGLTVASNVVLDARRASGGVSAEFAYLELVMPNGATVPAEIVYRRLFIGMRGWIWYF